MKKKEIVENDKTKIASVISELDQKKNEALQAAWKRVNKVCILTSTDTRTTCLLTTYARARITHVRLQYSKGYAICCSIFLPSSKGLWLHLLHSPPWYHRQAGATGGSDSAGWPGGQGGLQWCVEGHPD